MEFGYFAQAFVPNFEVEAEPGAEHRRLMENLDFAVECDRNGIKYVWCPEHHFLTEYSHMPAPEVFLSFVAARTTQIHVGSAIFNTTPPVNHPARVAERVAMLDHLSEGRFEFGTGRGSSSVEQRGFGIDDPDDTKVMFDEVIGEFKHMWRDGPYSHTAKSWSLPERNVLPKPWAKPHPPMWVAAGNPSTFEKAARMGLGVLCFTGGSPEKMRPLIEIYKERIADAEPVGEYVNDNVAVTTSFMCLEDGAEAIDWVTRSGNGRQQSLVFRYLDTFPRPAWVPEWPPTSRGAGLRAGVVASAFGLVAAPRLDSGARAGDIDGVGISWSDWRDEQEQLTHDAAVVRRHALDMRARLREAMARGDRVW